MISIHALLAESDNVKVRVICTSINFYPRSPCGERHAPNRRPCPRSRNFYPRSPCGERRCYSFRHSASGWYFYPRSPCGERHQEWSGSQQPRDFYPRSPCGERHITIITICTALKFLSTLSLRRATKRLWQKLAEAIISIHALLAESDVLQF